MKSITLKALIGLLIALYLYGCDNSTGPTIVNNTNNENNPPTAPKNPYPHADTTGINNIVNLSWTCSDPDAGDTLKYDVYFSQTTPPGLAASNYTATTYGLGVLDHGTLYYWKIVAKDNHGATTAGPIWKFTTAPVFEK